ncbi:cytochrome P450 oxidoreductase GliC [Amylocarpus encephaloides]|uniref:Cytochrome P450 oxidoreductase GliC n=1 Tax=Amylocarpus encephaloides TaxID=45428 RepID=A0A9P8C221_9HELO|nr:cytochrome P450 oxidoreductase GliC [Amylocarpus encephaloides]
MFDLLCYLPIVFGSTIIWAFSNLSMRRKIIDAISSITNALKACLLLRYPITSVNFKYDLPTCPYKWPDGQGDIGKFLAGEENGRRWRKQFGGLYRIWSGLVPEIVLTNPEHVQAVFADSDKHIKAVNNNSGWLLGELLGQCVGLISLGEWKSARRVTEIPFLHKRMEDYIESICHQVQYHVQDLHTAGGLKDGRLNPVRDLKLLPFRIVTTIIFGRLEENTRDKLEALIPLRERLFQTALNGGLARFWWGRLFRPSIGSSLKRFKKSWKAFNSEIYGDLKSKGVNTPLVNFYRAVDIGLITEIQMLQTLDEILFANLDVTMGGISWLLVFLASSPNIQAELRHEFENHGIHKSSWSELTTYVMSSSTLLSATIAESSRLKPLAPFSVPQAIPSKRTVGKFVFPKGTNFIVDTYALNTNPEFWGDDSTDYRPSRFLTLSPTKLRYNFWRFGFGPRQCMGKYIADVMMRALVIHILQNYELSQLSQRPMQSKDHTSWINHPDAVLSCERIER